MSAPNKIDARRLVLLAVEDSEADREMYERVLKQDLNTEYLLVSAWRKQDVIALYGKYRPDCLLLDYNLPGTNGLVLLKEIMYPSLKPHCFATVEDVSDFIAMAMTEGAGDEEERKVVGNSVGV